MSLTALAFLALFAGGLAATFLRGPIWGLYTYIAVFYLDAPGRWWGVDLPHLRWSLLAAGATVLAIILRRGARARRGWLSHAPVLLYLLFVGLMWLQWPWAITGADHVEGVTTFTKYLIVIFIIYAVIDERIRARDFLLAHAIGGLYLGMLALTAYAGGRLDGVGGPGIDDANTLAMQMCTTAFAGAGVFLSARGWKRWVSAAAIVLSVNTIIMSGSRGGFVALLMGGLAFAFFRPRGATLRVFSYSLIAVAMMGYLANDFFWERMQTIDTVIEDGEEAEKSAYSRIVILKAQWQMAKDHPLGVGHHGTTALSYTYIPLEYHASGGGRSSHSTLGSTLVDQGFLGFFIWLAMISALARELIRQRRYERQNPDPTSWILAAVAAGLAANVTGGLFAPYLRAEVFVWLMALAVSLVSLRQHNTHRSRIDVQTLHGPGAGSLRE